MQQKDAYAYVEDSTMDWVSFKPKAPKLAPRSSWFSTMILHKEEGNTNFSGLNHKLESSWVMPIHLGE
jgi:hypothetical protein